MRMMIRSSWLVTLILWTAACDRDGNVLQSTDSGIHHDGAVGGGSDAAGTCSVPPWVFPDTGFEPQWVTSSCPPNGCPSGTTCVHAAVAAGDQALGCAPIPAACNGTPTCDCMGCVCPVVGGGFTGGGASSCRMNNGLDCITNTISIRAAKDDIVYVDSEERERLAHQALQIPLARYRYKNEPADARRRLGFIIDDQPNPSPAVLADRQHVDEYGYTSMLLATVQQQAKEIAELQQRLDRLESAQSTRRR
jgi:hypothetical protein